MKLESISVKQLRESFPAVRQGLKKGISYLLIYRSKPIAKIEPTRSEQNSLNSVLNYLGNPPDKLQFASKKSAVDLIRGERK